MLSSVSGVARRFLGLDGGESRSKLAASLKEAPFVQLSNYTAFTERVVERCRDAFERAGRCVVEDVTAMAFDFTSNRGMSTRFDLRPNDARDAVAVSVEGDFFARKVIAMVMRHIPSTTALAACVADVSLGDENVATGERRRELGREIDDVNRALSGVVDALSIDEGELAALRAEHVGADDEAPATSSKTRGARGVRRPGPGALSRQ